MDFRRESDRVRSFVNWPGVHTPEELAAAGFYYEGQGERVRCFSCDIELNQWIDEDVPLTEHLKYSKDCAFAKARRERQEMPTEAGAVAEELGARRRVREPPSTHSDRAERHSRRGSAMVQPETSHQTRRRHHWPLPTEPGYDIAGSYENYASRIRHTPILRAPVMRRLEHGYHRERSRQQDRIDKVKCKICCDRDREIFFEPCAHVVACKGCSARMDRCPICRVQIKKYTRAYLA